MRIAAISDLHGVLPALPACDLLLIAGDVCPIHDHRPEAQAVWLGGDFRHWLCQVPARQVIGIAGNHDFVYEQMPFLVPRDLPWTYLEDSGVVWEGLKIYGSPWQPWFMDWAFNAGPDELAAKWRLIPDDTDILLVHGPPHDYGDLTRHGNATGCPHLLERIQEIQPRLVVFGHIHEGRGEWQLGRTKLANVTILDEDYRHVYPPWVVDL
jgi:predicted phosphodiesterase